MVLTRRISKMVSSKADDAAPSPGEEPKKEEESNLNLLHEFLHLKLPDYATIGQILKQLASGKPINDRHLLLEKVVVMMQKLPLGNQLGKRIDDAFITLLWDDLPHPPTMYLGDENRYRKADGSGNNPLQPLIGAAGQPYSRNVSPSKPRSPYLPDPELVFDQLLRRRDFTPHKGGLNRLFFSFATVIIHELFQTNYENNWINNTSSYFDLATLYGNNEDEQKRIRTYQNGLVHPDTISSARLMLMPPGPVALVMLFSRHHNYIAKRLFAINESGKYKAWDQCSESEQKWQDEDIFQLSRNINAAFFVKCVLTDYVSTILNTMYVDSEWHLEIGKEIKKSSMRVERGTGNSVSCEFNILYHWHAAVSATDDKWMEDSLKSSFPNVDSESITPRQYGSVMGPILEEMENIEPKDRTFGKLQCKADGTFDDVALGELIKDCIEEPAHAFGARSTPSSLKVIEIMGQLMARNTFHCATMNEFREYLRLEKFKSFQEWNPDEDVALAAEKLYGHIDNLELYPGLMAEEPKPNMPGSGMQPGHTIGRGILADAVALVRGDRFMAQDLNESTLTSWGLAQLQPAPGAYGGFLTHILQRGLPAAWDSGYSAHCLLPFHKPSVTQAILRKNDKLDRYDTERPKPVTPLHGLHSWQACKDAFENRNLLFAVPYEPHVSKVTDEAGFHLAWDNPDVHDPHKQVITKAFFEPMFEKHVRDYFGEETQKKIWESSLSFDHPPHRRQLDVVRDVFNVVPIHWAAGKYGIPLRTETSPIGVFSTKDMHKAMLAIFIFTSFNALPSAAWKLRDGVEQAVPYLRKILNARYYSTFPLANLITSIATKPFSSLALSEPAQHLYHTIHEAGWTAHEAVGELLGTMLPIGGNLTQQPALLLHLFLSPEYAYAKERLVELAHRDDEEAWSEFEMWVWEGMRLKPIVPGLLRTATSDATIRDGPEREIYVKKGERVVIATSKAHMDPTHFPEPEKLNPHRPRSSYIHMGAGMHLCFGARLVAPAIVAMLRPIFQLKNVRRAAGPSGGLHAVQDHLGHDGQACTIELYLDQGCVESPVPTSMVIEYDA